MHAKYQVPIFIGSEVMAKTPYLTLNNDIDLIMPPLKTHGFIRYAYMPIDKFALDKQLWPVLRSVILPIYLTFDLELKCAKMYGFVCYKCNLS